MTEQTAEETAVERAASRPVLGYAIAGVLVVIALGALTRFLEAQVPVWAADTPLERVAKSIEFPIYAIALGLIGNAVFPNVASIGGAVVYLAYAFVLLVIMFLPSTAGDRR